MKNSVLIVVLIVSGWIIVQGQHPQFYRQKAEQALERGDIYSGIILLEYYLTIQSDDISATLRLADAYRQTHQCRKALHKYLQVWNSVPDQYPEAGYWAAKMYQCVEEYEHAQEMFNRLLQMGYSEKTKHVTISIAEEIKACDSAMYYKKTPLYPAEVQDLPHVNTRWSEFNPGLLGDTLLYFSSLRPENSRQNHFTSMSEIKTNIYRSNVFGSRSSAEVEFFARELVHKKYHTANISFTADGQKAFFNRCTYNFLKTRCEIWMAVKQGEKWSKPERLPDVINVKGYTATQPIMVYDSVARTEVLYFASDRPGGFGGMDLWFSVHKNGTFQQPINLGSKINTSGNEISPYYDTHTRRLYFSTDGRPGMGGFDVFYAYGSMNEWSDPQNMWYPVNSGANDINFFVISENEAFVASNRPGKWHTEEDFCCYDIYYLTFQTITKSTQPVVEDVREDASHSMEQDIAELLPLALYFDNDHPDPRSLSPETRRSYDETYYDYVKRKDIFINEYTRGLHGFDYYYAQVEMEDFFDNYVSGSYQKLLILTDLLYQDLLSGNNVTLRVRGYTSPLTSTEYNMILARRRVGSLVNFFQKWNDGALKQFMEPDASVRFQIIEEPLGEVLANEYVSDNPHDRRMSVYSKAASLERRIEIELYEANVGKYKNLQQEQPILIISDNLVNIKHLVGQQQVMLTINFTNRGNLPLVIDDITSSDQSVVILEYDAIVDPGKNGTMKIVIQREIEKMFTVYLTIFANTPERRHVVYLTTLTTR